MKGAGGGNFDVSQWLGNTWMYSTSVGKDLRKMLEGYGEHSMFKIVRENLGNDPAHIDFVKFMVGKSDLNQCQKRAIQTVLKAREFALIQGFPGSGKTHVIVVIIRILLKLGRRVLITAHTHSAVDNMLLRIEPHLDQEMKLKTVRIGHEHNINSTFSDLSNMF